MIHLLFSTSWRLLFLGSNSKSEFLLLLLTLIILLFLWGISHIISAALSWLFLFLSGTVGTFLVAGKLEVFKVSNPDDAIILFLTALLGGFLIAYFFYNKK